MKILVKMLLVLLISCLCLNSSISQDVKTIPSASIKNLKNETIDTKTFNNEGKPFVINFWATWCKPCIMELNAISEVYEEWQKETGIKIFAISVDDSRSSKKVAPFVKSRNWKYDSYLDENSDFKRAMNVNNPPHTFLYNGKGELVWQHNGYAPGDEEELYKQIKKLLDEK
ncbi:MAG TPA: TlpA disulfide reductase family protein [Candidatus Kapabacteria bacterium]|nr:TlpA disulfide reductase family protein [Candidatus Kapabacteria bacterium]HPO62443.1 TlpA disulfide reductase family protein [Candidatus Kapabacteria bacterium]